jgi:hypothetical protein
MSEPERKKDYITTISTGGRRGGMMAAEGLGTNAASWEVRSSPPSLRDRAILQHHDGRRYLTTDTPHNSPWSKLFEVFHSHLLTILLC